MKYAVETVSHANFHKDSFRRSKVNMGDSQTHSVEISQAYFTKQAKKHVENEKFEEACLQQIWLI
jgi:hypothetical protein